MNTLQAALDDYLALRRALGFELRLAGRLLQRFVDFAQAANATYITAELAHLYRISAFFSYEHVVSH